MKKHCSGASSSDLPNISSVFPSKSEEGSYQIGITLTVLLLAFVFEARGGKREYAEERRCWDLVDILYIEAPNLEGTLK